MRPCVFRVNARGADPVHGRVVWAPAKSLWFNGHLLIALVGGPLTYSVAPVLLCLGLTYLTLLLGHSVGMHRRLIHRTFRLPVWLDGFFIYLGVLVGIESETAWPNFLAQIYY